MRGNSTFRIAWSMALFEPGLVPRERFCFLVALEWTQSAEIDLPRPRCRTVDRPAALITHRISAYAYNEAAKNTCASSRLVLGTTVNDTPLTRLRQRQPESSAKEERRRFQADLFLLHDTD